MFPLVTAAFLSFLMGFVCPPAWIITLLAIRAWVRIGRAAHADAYERHEMARIKAYRAWSA